MSDPVKRKAPGTVRWWVRATSVLVVLLAPGGIALDVHTMYVQGGPTVWEALQFCAALYMWPLFAYIAATGRTPDRYWGLQNRRATRPSR